MGKNYVGLIGKAFACIALLVAANAYETADDYEAYDSFPSVLFSHGIVDDFTQANKYVGHLFGNNFHAVHYRDGSHHFPKKIFKASKSTLGQSGEIVHLYADYQKYIKTLPDDEPIALMGVSRGASLSVTLFSDPNRDLSRVKALILESGFDDPLHVFRFFGSKVGLGNLSDKKYYKMAHIAFPSFKPDGETPLKAIENIPLDLPILLVCSKKDAVVPSTSTIGLYKKLIETGHTRVHLLLFSYGKHSKIICKKQLGATYKNVVHAFYKHYGFRHNPQAALNGQEAFSHTFNPTLS